jgi:hypothetical protein
MSNGKITAALVGIAILALSWSNLHTQAAVSTTNSKPTETKCTPPIPEPITSDHIKAPMVVVAETASAIIHGVTPECMRLIEPLKPKPTSLNIIYKRMKKQTNFLLGACPSVYSIARRRVYVDLGARDYDSSVGFFRKFYPQGDTFEVHAFEVDPKYRAMGYDVDKRTTLYTAAAWTGVGCIAMGSSQGFAGASYKMKFVKVNGTLDAPTIPECEALIPKQQDMIGPIPTVDIASFLTKTLGLTGENSFVVLKVDIEGPEWTVMDHLRATGALAVVKETMIECHWDTHGGPFKGIPLSECHRQQQRLRDAGVYAHEWY